MKDELTANAAQHGNRRKTLSGGRTARPSCTQNGRAVPSEGHRAGEGPGHPESRTEASEALRGRIDAIVLTPDQGELQIELKGNLAAMLGAAQKAKRSPETGDLSLQVLMVAGAGFEPATFGL